jgi:hypothetical protein
MDDLRDTFASLTAAKDQHERAFGEALGLDRGVPLDAYFLVSPDVGQRLTRDGVIPARVRISWMLPPGTMYAVAREVFDGVVAPRVAATSRKRRSG